jgi:signal transduction histidine kinase
MAMDAGSELEILSRFSRLISTSNTPEGVLALLADAGVEHMGASAVAVLELRESGRLELAGSSGLPDCAAGFVGEVDALGPELGEQMRKRCAPDFAQAHTLLMMSGGDLFGAMVLLFRSPTEFEPNKTRLVETLVELSAVAISHASRYAALSRSYAELRASRVALARSHKLRALGQMAAGVSHDLKNILNPISLYVQVLQRAIPRGDTATIDEAIEQMRATVKRGVEVIDRLRDFSRQTPATAVEVTDLDSLAREAIELSRARFASNSSAAFKIRIELTSPPPVRVEPSDLVSALTNLMINAVDAMHGGGTITVASGEARGGSWISVSDDGPGMPPEVEKKVFEPFFTTKGSDGTGLGLAMVYACVQRHKGEITLRTAPGEGASFTLWFPGIDAPPPSSAAG